MKYIYQPVFVVLATFATNHIAASEELDVKQPNLSISESSKQSSKPSGESIYLQSCVACHGSDGEGVMPGIPDLTEKSRRLDQADDLLVKRMMEGFQSPGSPIAMPAKGGNPNLSAADMRTVLEYISIEFR